jgi:hypothetical protein
MKPSPISTTRTAELCASPKPLAGRIKPPTGAWLKAAAGALACCWLAGCGIIPSHVHNEAKAKLAAGAQARMQEYSKNAPAMYAAMSANVDKFKVEEEYVLSELAKNFRSALATNLPTLSWEKINERAGSGKGRVDQFHKTVAKEGRAFRERTRLAKARAATAQAQIDKAKEEVKAAKENVASWNAYIALLQQGFKDLPDEVKNLNAGSGVDALKGLTGAAQAIGNREIVFKDADGKEVRKKVSKIVAEQAEKIGSAVTDKDAKGKPLFPKAPGISLLIMNHALELAELELRKAEMELAQASERLTLFEDAMAETSVAKQLYLEVIAESESKPPAEKDQATPMPFISVAEAWRQSKTAIKQVTTLEEPDRTKPVDKAVDPRVYASDLATNENSIAMTALALRKLAIAESILARNESLFKVRIARLEHQASIAKSQLADATHRALIQAQLDGLLAYHQGGFTKEDAANIVRIAQSIALFSIANNTQ